MDESPILPPGPADCGDPRFERTHRVALEAAQAMLIDGGIGAVSFDGVSRRTGISRSTLYRHWSRPVDLLIAAYERLSRPQLPPTTKDLFADLCEMFIAARDGIEGGQWRHILPSLIHAADTDPELAELHRQFIDERRQPALHRLREARDRGELSPDADLDLALDLMISPLFYRALQRHTPTTDDDIRRTVAVVLSSLAIR